MKKQSSILSFALSLFFFSVVIGSNTQAQQGNGTAKSDVSVSRSISSGEYASDGKPMVIVTITIKKDAFRGPGQIQENFSNDFQAVLISSSSASFQKSSGKAQFTWDNIPDDRVITVSYSLEAMVKTGANQAVSGQFLYQNQTFTIYPTPFSIDTTNLPAYKPVTNTSNNTSTLDDLFSSVTGTNPAPTPSANTTAPSSNTSSSTSTSTQPVHQQPVVTTSTAPVQQSITPPPIQQTPAETAPIQQTAPVTTTPAPVQQTAPITTTPAPVQQTAPITTTPAPVQQTTPAPVQQTPSETPSASSTASANTIAAPGDIIYRVQIIEVGDKAKLPRFLKQHNISETLYYDPVNDTPVRVMVGNYADYNSAKTRCSELRSKGLTEAFVAPYYMGERITMEEAATHTQH